MKKYLLTMIMTITMAVGPGGLSGTAYAVSPTDSAKSQACTGINGISSSTPSSTCSAGGVDLSKSVKAVLNVLSVIAGVAAVIMIIVSGLRYITSNGEAQAVSGAKRGLIYAIVGLVVVAFSQIIVHFVLYNAGR